jgi:hypothetical protein
MDRNDQRARDLLYFLIGPGLITVATAVAFHFGPWPVPVPSQGQIFQPLPVAVILALGAVGVVLAPRAGLPPAPSLADGERWREILLWSLAPGIGFGVALFGVDAVFGVTTGAARALGVTWINVALPTSLAHYAAAGVLLECVYRLIPIPILTWLVSGVIFRRRGQTQVFWSLAVLTSLLEPASQIGGATGAINGALITLMILTFAANLFEAAHLRRHGWPAPILFRIAFYGVWHCFGPYLLPPQSILYPGLH